MGREIPVVIVAGPTASGKSSLALSLAETFGGEIINADSMQVYREFNILTARPSPEDEARVPHHLYGGVSVDTPCSAGAWLDLAVPVVEDIHGRGHLPIICGGTGLYLKVLQEGIAPVPDVSAEVISEATVLYDRVGGEAFREHLAGLDPDGASKLEPGDRQRLIRAFAVVSSTGRSLSAWQAEQSVESPLNARFFTIHLIPPRDRLYHRIEQRFDTMIKQGALEEVRAIQSLNLDPRLPALKALGVPDFQRYLADEVSLEEAVDKAKQGTRNFAKRQLTWFRNQSRADLVIEEFGGDEAFSMAKSAIGEFLLA